MRPDPRYAEVVRGMVERALRGHRAEVFLFGSWARGEAGRLSDMDVAILPKDELPWIVLSKLREELEESSVPYPVEVVDLREASPDLRARVLREGIRWSA